MTFLVPVMMFGWIPFTVSAFALLSSRRAVLVSVIGGVLLLPMATYNIPGIPDYTKTTAIAVGLLLGVMGAGRGAEYHPRLHPYDTPMVLLCFIVPFATAMSNNLGMYDGVSSMVQRCLGWGVFYYAGRRFFASASSLRQLTMGIIIGGAFYIPLILFELRMSPQLSNIFYGFFPHSWMQHVRYGGYRPIVFMQHGLMVAFWMTAASVAAYSLLRSREVNRILGVSASFVVVSLVGMAILCKSANGWVFLILGLAAFSYYRAARSTRLLRLLMLLIPVYIALRLTNTVSSDRILGLADLIFEQQRVRSLGARLWQEGLFGAHALERPWFGWGGWGRHYPVDPMSGERLAIVNDSLWIIVFSTNGFFGLASVFGVLGIGPWAALGTRLGSERDGMAAEDRFSLDAVVLSLIVMFHMIDCLFNAMLNPVFILVTGALVSYRLNLRTGEPGVT